MAALVVLGVIALVGAIVAWVTWHRGADERESVQHHQHTLDTLRHLADRRSSTMWPASRRGSPPKSRASSALPGTGRAHENDRLGAPRPPANGAARPKRSTTTRHDAALPSSGAGGSSRDEPRRRAASGTPARESAKVDARRRQTLVFADDPAGETRNGGGADRPIAARRPGVRLPGAADQARREGRARVRRTRMVAAAAVVVIVVGVGAALAVGPSHHTPPVTHHASRPITAAGHGLPSTTVASSHLTPSEPTAFSAKYSAPSSTYTVAVDASAPCWVLATDPSSGHVEWAGTVVPGTPHSLAVTGSVVVQLGAPSDASVTMDGQPVQLPTGFRSPFNLTFVPVA